MHPVRTLLRTTIAAGVVAVALLTGLVGGSTAGAHEGVPGAQPHDNAAFELGLDHLALAAGIAAAVALAGTVVVRLWWRRHTDDAPTTESVG